MDPAALARRLQAHEGRLAGSDAERRAAAIVAAQLRAGGRRPRVSALWVRPRRDLPRALYALLGVAASVVAVGDPGVGLGIATAALLAALLEAAGVPVASLLQVRRATQNVVAPPRDGGRKRRVLLVLAASVDAPADALLQRLEQRLLLGAGAWLIGSLAGVAACAGARLAGAEGGVVGAVQLVPSVVLILLLGGFAEAASAEPRRRAPAGGAPAAVAVAAALDAQPPRNLAAEVLIAGAGPLGMRAYVRSRRRDLRPEEVVVLHLEPGEGPLRYVARVGEHLPLRLHPRLVELAAALPGALPAPRRGHTIARVARGARWPALTLEGEPRALAAAALRLVAAVDAELARGAP